MPYIRTEERESLDPAINSLITALGRSLTPGKLNYVFSRIIWKIFEDSKNYTSANTLLGVLSAVTQEFYRRQIGPYEDYKAHFHGDII